MSKNRMTKKTALRLTCIALTLLLLIGAAVYTVLIQSKAGEDIYVFKEETVKRGDLVQGVMESGKISLEESTVDYSVNLSSDDEEDEEDGEEDEEEIRYLEIGEVYVVSGQRISEGDPLFAITEKSRQAVIKKLRAALTEKEIALSEAKASYNTQILEAKSTYDTSRLTADSAGLLHTGTITQVQEELNGLQAEIAVLELEVNQCLKKLTDEDFLESLSDAQTDFEKAKKKYEATDPRSVAAYTANYNSYQTAKQQYESLLSQKEGWETTISENEEQIHKNNADVLEKQTLLEKKQVSADNTYTLNKSAGELASEIYAYTKQSLQNEVETAQEECEKAEETLAELTGFAGEDGVIYADGSGLVTGVYYEEGDKLTQTGALLSYVKEDAYTVSIDVSEEDVADISIGDSVQIVFDAYPEAEYSGTVSAVTTTKTSDHAKTVSYPVEIKIQGDTGRLYGGMTAEITFVTDSAEDVLYVSRKAVETIDGKTWVYVGEGEEKERREVVTGFSNSTQVEIKDGLAENDIIYIKSKATEELQ